MLGMSVQGRWLLGIAVIGVSILSGNRVLGQITPDRTLPNNSIVTPNGKTFNITGGTQAGRNLFHSFQEFSVLNGDTASFNNGLDIQNIFSRVTGGSVSNIDGIIKANGTANLFFLNPNGIVFGKNATLNVGGSFVATTANAIQFGNQGTFSASAPNNPALLTVNPTALFYNQIVRSASIQNSSTAPAGVAPTGSSASGLRVPDGKSLLLVGGDIQMDGGRLRAYGGRVELGGLAATGTVGLGVDGNNLSLSFPAVSTRSDVSLLNGASVNVSAAGGGSITVNASNLNISGGSALFAGIGQGLGSVGSQAGDITLNATGDVKLDGSGSGIGNIVGQEAIGNGGNIQITTAKLSLSNGAQLQASTLGQGNAGNVIINAAKSVSLDNSGILSDVGDVNNTENNIVNGNGGNIQITTDQFSLSNGAQLQATTFGQGNAGNVIINASGKVSFDGTSSGAVSTVGKTGVGKGGDIRISADSLSVTNGALLAASTSGKGDAGNVIIDARNNVSFDNGSALSTVFENGVGKGGDIRISADSLSVTNGALLDAATSGKGDSGNVIIDARNNVSFDNGSALSTVFENGVGKGGDIRISADSLSVTNGALLDAATSGKGDAGNVIIDARNNVSFDNGSASSTVLENGVGKGGDIRISADSLSVTNGALLAAGTLGKGDSGNIEINAPDSVSVKGTSSSSGISCGLFTSTNSAIGIGGDITVNTPLLRVSDGAVLDAQTANNRNGGNITLNVKQAEILNGGQLIATSSGAGNAGKITVNATDRVIVDGSDRSFNTRLAKFGTDVVAPVDASSGLFVRSQSTGSAGDINVTSPQIRLDNEARFIAESASGSGGNINLQVRDLLLLVNGSLISTSAGTANAGGNGGNITINTPNGFIVAFPDESSNITANAYTGIGGRVQINATGVYGIQFRNKQNPLTNNITASSEFGSAGTVQLNIPNNDLTQGLAVLQSQLVNVDNLIANSCIVRTHQKQGGTFFITGSDGLPNRPGDVSVSSYPTGEVRSLPGRDKGYRVSTSRPWHKGDPIVEPQGVYQLPNGHLVLSRECNN